jgi:hypothetical protein
MKHHPKPNSLVLLSNLIAELKPNMKIAKEDELVENRPLAVRRSYKLNKNRLVVQQIDALISSGHSHCNACQIIGILPLYYHQ